MSPKISQADSLADRVEELTTRLKGGEAVDLEAYLAERPGHASELRRLLPALELLADVSRSGGASYPPVSGEEPTAALGELGDFRLVREVGRGGMGIVYEAEQISLRRRVALKVLPFAATMDPRHLQRFQNEARAAACLHHEHIVPVYWVGCERGVHFFAMQFVEGQTLAALIAGQTPTAVRVNAVPPSSPVDHPTTPYAPAAETAAAASTSTPPSDGAYFRRVAEWGIQAAEALEHAHALGIVHRDVKPANLMLDGQGKLWVTDFGLARTMGDSGLTVSGDLLGTLRYMSPEQALAKHDLVDHRTDVYSLGATLYELLSGRPVVDGKDRQEVLLRIAFEEPAAPQRLNRAVPMELETIVLKSMAKEPGERYATARELADDLGRFLEVRPILARPPTWTQRLRKWARRHPELVWSGVAILVVLMVALASVAVLARDRERKTADALEKQTNALESERQAVYLYRVSLAARERQAGTIQRARELLDLCPESLRRWEWHHLRRSSPEELTAAPGAKEVLEISPDGRLVILSPRMELPGGPCALLDAANGAEIGTIRPGAAVSRARFSGDGSRLALALREGQGYRLKVWDVETGRLLATLAGHGTAATTLAFSTDGNCLASGANDRTVRVWDLARREEVGCLRGHSDNVRGIAFSRDGTRLCSAGADRTARVWDLTTFKEVSTLRGHAHAVTDVTFSPDGSRLATASIDNTVRLWDVTGAREVRLLPLDGLNYRLSFSPDGCHLLASGPLRTAVWDMRNGVPVTTLPGNTLPAFFLDAAHVAWPHGRTVKRLALRQLHGCYSISDDPGAPPFRAAFSPDGRLLALGTLAGTVKVLNREDGSTTGKELPHGDSVWSVAFSPDGKRLASAGEGGVVKVWDLATRLEVYARKANTHTTFSVAYSPDGRHLAAAGGDDLGAGTVQLWEAETGQALRTMRQPRGRCFRVAFSPNSRLLAAAGETTTDNPARVKLWDLVTGEEVLTLAAPPDDNLPVLAFGPDGKRIAWSATGSVRLTDLESGREVSKFTGFPGALSPDGQRLATCTSGGVIKLWDIGGEEILTLRGHTEPILDVAFSPDGRSLVSVGYDFVVKVWDGPP